MSFHVTSICTNHKFSSATRKQVITLLADKSILREIQPLPNM